MRSATVVAQAKINLFLRVLAREVSGYHQLESLFCRLTLGDEVRVRLTEGGRSLDCAGIAMPPGGLGPVEKNLAWRAAEAWSQAGRWAQTHGWRVGAGPRSPRPRPSDSRRPSPPTASTPRASCSAWT